MESASQVATRPEIDRDLLLDVTRRLITFRSVNPPGNEGDAAEYLAKTMRDAGLEVEVQTLEPDRSNVIGRLRGEGEGSLVFTGHLDVVSPGEQEWAHPPFEADMVDGRIYGRGAADMKGGLAAMTLAAGALSRAGFKPRADLVIAATAGEEAGMIGALTMVERASLKGARYLVVGEPSDLDVFIGEKGVLWLAVRAFGRTAHGSMPSLGVNAVSFLARLIPQIEEYPFPFTESRLLGKPTISVNVMTGGKNTNVVPDLAKISIDMRTVPGQDHPEIIATIRSLAEEAAARFHPDLRVEIDVQNDKPPVETDPGEPLVTATVESARGVLGRKPAVAGVTYGTDAAVLGPGFGIPMVICGPGSAGMAHQPNEHVEVEQLVQAAQVYADLAIRLLGSNP